MKFKVRFVSNSGIRVLFNAEINPYIIHRLKELYASIAIDKYIKDLYEYDLEISRDVAEKSGLFRGSFINPLPYLDASIIEIDVPIRFLEAFTSIYAKWEGKMIVLTKKINPKKLLDWWISEGFPVKF